MHYFLCHPLCILSFDSFTQYLIIQLIHDHFMILSFQDMFRSFVAEPLTILFWQAFLLVSVYQIQDIIVHFFLNDLVLFEHTSLHLFHLFHVRFPKHLFGSFFKFLTHWDTLLFSLVFQCFKVLLQPHAIELSGIQYMVLNLLSPIFETCHTF